MILYVVFIIVIIALIFFLVKLQNLMNFYRLKYEKDARRQTDLKIKLNKLEDKICINEFNKIYPKYEKKK